MTHRRPSFRRVALLLGAMLALAAMPAAASATTTVSVSPAAGYSSSRALTISTDSLTNDSAWCQIDGTAPATLPPTSLTLAVEWTSCGTPDPLSGPAGAITYPAAAYADGVHTIYGATSDAFGGTGEDDVVTFTVDTTAPDTLIDTTPANPSGPTGNGFAFHGADPGGTGVASLECSLDGGAFGVCTSPDALGPLADGAHTYAVRAIDVAGNTDASPASYAWTVDAVDPDSTITAQPAAITQSTTATFSFGSTDTGGSGVASTDCSLDGGAYGACTSPQSYPGLADGGHTFDVRAVDNVGNVEGSPASYAWTVDTTAPATTILTHPTAPTASNTASFTFSGSDGGGTGVASFECKLDGGPFAACTSAKAYAGLADGSHTFRVRAIDNAGNVDASPDTFTWVVDTTPPNTSITSRPANPTASTVANFGFNGSDVGGTGVASFQCRRDVAGVPGAWGACTSVDAGTAAEGNRTFDVRAIDNVGNIDASPAHYAWLVDLTDPTVDVITAPPLRTQDAYSPGSPPNFTSPQLVHPFYALDSGAPNYHCTDPDGGVPAGHSGIASCTDNFDNSTLGNHLFVATAVDRVGHVYHSPPRAYRIVPPDYANFLQANHPTAYYRLDDPTGASVDGLADSSGHGNRGTYQNGVVLRRSPALKCERWDSPYTQPDSWCDAYNFEHQGYSAFFDGKADHAFINNIDASGDADHGQVNHASFSAEAWGYPIGTQQMGLMEHGEEYRVYYDGRWHARLVNGTELVGPAQASDRWYHVGVSWDGNTVRLFVNGVQVDSHSGVTHSWAGGQPTMEIGRTNIPSTWWHGYIDEVAYYNGQVLSQDDFADHYEIGQTDEPSGSGAGTLDMTRPTIAIREPATGATYTPTSTHPPHGQFSCSDADGPGDVTSCVATVDGSALALGAALPLTVGTHDVKVVAFDASGLRFEYHHTYVVEPFTSVVLGDHPEGYYRFDEASTSHDGLDSSGHGNDGIYKNDTANGPAGISGDGNTTRQFLGLGGYLYVNGVPAGNLGWTSEAWVEPNDRGDMVVMDHGAGGSSPALFLRGQHLVLHLPDPDDELVDPSAFPYDGAFHQVAATWDGVTAKLFVDGAKVAERESSAKIPSGVSTLYYGFGNVGLSRPWLRGALDEASYYSTPLTDQRIYEHFIADPPFTVSTGTGTGTGTTPTVTPTPPTASTAPAQTPTPPEAIVPAAPVTPISTPVAPKTTPKVAPTAQQRAHARAVARAKARARKARAQARARAKARGRARHH